jgi:hypothetical protein
LQSAARRASSVGCAGMPGEGGSRAFGGMLSARAIAQRRFAETLEVAVSYLWICWAATPSKRPRPCWVRFLITRAWRSRSPRARSMSRKSIAISAGLRLLGFELVAKEVASQGANLTIAVAFSWAVTLSLSWRVGSLRGVTATVLRKSNSFTPDSTASLLFVNSKRTLGARCRKASNRSDWKSYGPVSKVAWCLPLINSGDGRREA